MTGTGYWTDGNHYPILDEDEITPTVFVHGFDWDECQADYDTGLAAWVLVCDQRLRVSKPVCGGSDLDGELACGLSERRPSGTALLVLAALFGLRRRTRRGQSD